MPQYEPKKLSKHLTKKEAITVLQHIQNECFLMETKNGELVYSPDKELDLENLYHILCVLDGAGLSVKEVNKEQNKNTKGE